MNAYLLKKKHQKLLYYLKFSGDKFYKIKVDKELSPIGWHLLHCIYTECLWIRSYFNNDDEIKNKIKNVSDASKVRPSNRGKELPSLTEIYVFAKKTFKENLEIISKIEKNSQKKKYSIKYIIKFLENHHSQHLETIKNILNAINIEYNLDYIKKSHEIVPIDYKLDSIKINKGIYKIGTDEEYVCDNEKPEDIFETDGYEISKNIITIQNWYAFIEDGGYKNKIFWSKSAWNWIKKNNINAPFNWKVSKKKVSLSFYNGYMFPSANIPVSNISWFELKAFAKWKKLKVPHEHHWEIASNKIKDKNLVWEWSNNKFYGYKNFKAFPYDEYSLSWLNKNYFTLKGASILTEDCLKRISFRNFYRPHTRYICSGGRLCNY